MVEYYLGNKYATFNYYSNTCSRRNNLTMYCEKTAMVAKLWKSGSPCLLSENVF